MKRILFVIENFKVGGIQRSLVNMLNGISGSYEIDVMPFDRNGEYLDKLPRGINLIQPPAHYKSFAMPLNSLKGYHCFVYKALFGFLTKMLNKGIAFKICSPFYHIDQEYDAAISFSHSGFYKSVNGICPEFVLNKTKSKRKICFIHCDYQNSGMGCIYNDRLYDRFDQIACCSDSVKMVFLASNQQLTSKTVTVRNFYDLSIGKYEPEDMALSNDRINVFSVARLSKEKGIDRAVLALAQSKRKDICYYIIGDGSMREAICNLIRQEHLEDQVFLLGADSEPYPKLMNADYLLVPSYNEAAPMVFDEAAVLNVPIISTETTSAREMLGQNDIICSNSAEGLEKALRELKKPIINRKGTIFVKNELQKEQFRRLLKA